MDYHEFLISKIPTIPQQGFTPETPCPDWFKPHQPDCCHWAIEKGRAALFESFGMGKTVQQLQLMRWVHEKTGGKVLIVAPLGVRQEFTLNDGPRMGMKVIYCRTNAEVAAADSPYIITNYERVRDGGIDPSQFAGATLDEASCLRSYGSLTTQTFVDLFRDIPYRFVATATPSPNEFLELINYAHFLGVMDRGQALTRFFQRDSKKAGNLTLYPHMEEQFWLWVASWAVFVNRPSDLGYSDEGYDLPEMFIEWHEVQTQQASPGDYVDSFGQPLLFERQEGGIKHVAKNKRNSLKERLEKVKQILKEIGVGHGRQGSKEGGVSAGILRKEPRKTPERAEGKGEKKLQVQSGKIRKAIKGVEGAESREVQAVNRESCEKKPGENARAFTAVVSEQQSESIFQVENTETEGVWADPRPVSGDGRSSELSVPNMQEGVQSSLCGSLPLDRDCERATLQVVQCGAGGIQGQPGGNAECNSVFEQVVIWCHLNNEQQQIERMLKTLGVSCSSIDGGMEPDEKERRLVQWLKKETQVLLSKPEILGSGCNLQQSCKMIFAGIDYKFNDIIQSIHRQFRFLQTRNVTAYFIYSDMEFDVRRVIENKWERHNELTLRMREIIKQHGLSGEALKMKFQRTLGTKRAEVTGKTYRAIHNDCVEELKNFDSDCIDEIVTSIPFSDHYEYSPSINDFGHNNGDEGFFKQFDFLVPELLRVLKPGRIAAIHTKDRIQYGKMTGHGMYTVNEFSDKTVTAFKKHGFLYMGRITIDTDVVRENAQSYRLGWSENAEDSTKMGCGSTEFVLLFRKWEPAYSPNSTANGPEPVKKDNEAYTRSHWQLQACGIWRSNGNELLSPEMIARMSMADIMYWWKNYCETHGYDYEKHVQFCQAVEDLGHLPSGHMLFPPHSNNPDIWTDILRINTLNTALSMKQEQSHVCPLQLDVIQRLIERFSNPGDTILDPFGGVHSVPYQAIKMGRKGIGIELNPEYWRMGVSFCERAEQKLLAPTLFDLELAEA